MKNEISFSVSKVLVINNTIILNTDFKIEEFVINSSSLVLKMGNSIKHKWLLLLGILMRKTVYYLNKDDIFDIRIFLIGQVDIINLWL